MEKERVEKIVLNHHVAPILVSAQKIKRIRTKQLLDPRIDETV